MSGVGRVGFGRIAEGHMEERGEEALEKRGGAELPMPIKIDVRTYSGVLGPAAATRTPPKS